MGLAVNLMGAAFALIVVTGGVVFRSVAFSDSYGFDYNFAHDFILGFAYFVCTLLGVFSSLIYRRIEAKKSSTRKLTFSQIFHKVDLVRALILSPIIFVVVVNNFGQDSNILMSLLFAYQNGFFWETLVKKEPAEAAHTL